MSSSLKVALSGGDLDCGEMDTQSCMEDHAILAIFVDSVIASEVGVTAHRSASFHFTTVKRLESICSVLGIRCFQARPGLRVVDFMVELEFSIYLTKNNPV